VSDPAPASAADALDAANSLAGRADPSRAPRARPPALAFAGAGLDTPGGEIAPRPVVVASLAPTEDLAAPPPAAPQPVLAGQAEAPGAAKGDRVQLAALPVAEDIEPAYTADADDLAEIIGAPAEAKFSGFALPQPTGAPGLYTVPETAAEIAAGSATPKLPTLRFAQPQEAAPPVQESFLSRLFASLSQ
jgi:hypothetical protein